MNNASIIYEKTEDYSDIQKFVDQKIPETLYLDFKEAQNPARGKMQDGDKAHYAKAASGFAHQEGGVLVWGITARKDEKDANYANGLKPISNIRTFLSDLHDYVQYATEPGVDGVQHKLIYENGDESANKGFAVSLFPKSNSEHIAKGKNTSDFYKRYGDSFVPLGTADIKALFFRTLLPDMELVVSPNQNTLTLFLKNNGSGVAKNCSIHVGLQKGGRQILGTWNDGEGNSFFRLAQSVRLYGSPAGRKYTQQVRLNPGVVLHPEEEASIAVVNCGEGQEPIKVDYGGFCISPPKGALRDAQMGRTICSAL